MTNQRSASADTQARQRRAYAIVKQAAMMAGYMNNLNDVAGFVAWCEEWERLNGEPSIIIWPGCLPSKYPPDDGEDIPL